VSRLRGSLVVAAFAALLLPAPAAGRSSESARQPWGGPARERSPAPAFVAVSVAARASDDDGGSSTAWLLAGVLGVAGAALTIAGLASARREPDAAEDSERAARPARSKAAGTDRVLRDAAPPGGKERGRADAEPSSGRRGARGAAREPRSVFGADEAADATARRGGRPRDEAAETTARRGGRAADATAGRGHGDAVDGGKAPARPGSSAAEPRQRRRSAPPPAPAREGFEECIVVLAADDGDDHHFYAVAEEGGGAVARSPVFRARRSAGVMESGAARDALQALVTNLLAAGWQVVGRDDDPWALRFRRRVAAAQPVEGQTAGR